MSIVVIGAQGQLGKELVSQLGEQAIPLTHQDIEITDPKSIQNALDEYHPDALINAAAYNFVDRAEEEPEKAMAVNAFAVQKLAEECQSFGIPLVHVSTDYVFGQSEIPEKPYTETDEPLPNSAYSKSKYAGEQFIRSICSRYFLIRTCGLYGIPSEKGKGNFVETMLRLGSERKELNVVDDQTCTPSSAKDIASAMIQLMKTDQYGLYHVTNAGSVTWCEFAREIFAQANMDVKVNPITTQEFGAAANRPVYSVLDCSKIDTITGHPIRHWKEALKDYLSNRD